MENPFEEKSIQRPTFLMVLCILTFIYSGWGVLSNLFSLFTANLMSGAVDIEQYSSMVGNMEEQGISSFLSGFMNSSIEVLQATIMHAREIAVMQLILSVVSLVGAILMFQLKRLGFYFYTAAQILMLFVMPYFAGFTIVVIMAIAFGAIFNILFIILYALNLKSMNR